MESMTIKLFFILGIHEECISHIVLRFSHSESIFEFNAYWCYGLPRKDEFSELHFGMLLLYWLHLEIILITNLTIWLFFNFLYFTSYTLAGSFNTHVLSLNEDISHEIFLEAKILSNGWWSVTNINFLLKDVLVNFSN